MKIENLNLAAMRYFIDAVEQGSLSKSAEKNHVTRPAVSQAIFRLEDWYGKSLCTHEKKNFILTEHGKNLYRVGKEIFQKMEKVISNGPSDNKALRLGCSTSLVDLVFPMIQRALHKADRPEIRVGRSSRLLEMLELKQVNLALLIEDHLKHSFESQVIHSGNFELRSKTGVLTDVLVTTEPRPEVESLLRYFRKKRIQSFRHIEVDSWTAAMKVAAHLSGTCLVPDFLPGSPTKHIRLRDWLEHYTVRLVWPKNAVLSHVEGELVESLR